MAKIDLTLLKRLISEAEVSVEKSEKVMVDLKARVPDVDHNEYIVELSKAAGLFAGVMSEASMLVLDVQALMQAVQGPSPAKAPSTQKSDALSKALEGLAAPSAKKPSCTS